MTELSIVVLNRMSDDPMSSVLSSLPQLEGMEVVYVTPAAAPDQPDGVRAVRVNPGVLRVEYPRGLGGIEADRLLGAIHASGAHILFMDTHQPLLQYEITNLRTPLMNGASVVLRSRFPRDPEMGDPVDLAAAALNLIMDRPELGAASLTRLPNSLSRDVFQTVPREELLNPQRFLAKCAVNRLRVETFYREHDAGPPVSDAALSHMLADHMGALREITEQKGPRGGFTDLRRRRDAKVGLA